MKVNHWNLWRRKIGVIIAVALLGIGFCSCHKSEENKINVQVPAVTEGSESSESAVTEPLASSGEVEPSEDMETEAANELEEIFGVWKWADQVEELYYVFNTDYTCSMVVNYIGEDHWAEYVFSGVYGLTPEGNLELDFDAEDPLATTEWEFSVAGNEMEVNVIMMSMYGNPSTALEKLDTNTDRQFSVVGKWNVYPLAGSDKQDRGVRIYTFLGNDVYSQEIIFYNDGTFELGGEDGAYKVIHDGTALDLDLQDGGEEVKSYKLLGYGFMALTYMDSDDDAYNLLIKADE